MSWPAFTFLLAGAASAAFLLGLAVALALQAKPLPRRFGAFDLERDGA